MSGGNGKDLVLGEDGNDQLFGEVGDDELLGSAGNDSVFGGDGNDRLLGSNPFFTLPDLNGERDALTGGRGSDTFVLGVGREVFYDTQGNSDFALINDFTLGQDFVELPANSQSANGDPFSLGATSTGIPQGTGIFFENDLIGVIAGIAPAQLSLDDNFIFI
ncbi:MAG: hypothetical protein KME05_15050 [Gloeocapsa sp. UFS-A4-WI-NPMV-4B04]|nr:hypothetical protein [Gloeocapsa sp. UFS-A4-WI-NPMV-4B04]